MKIPLRLSHLLCRELIYHMFELLCLASSALFLFSHRLSDEFLSCLVWVVR